MIQFCDLKRQYQTIKKEIDKAIKEVIESTSFILGKQVKELEEEVAKYCGVKYAIGVASGTDAILLALIASGIGEGDEVITTPLTFVATTESIIRAGAKPVFVDIDERTYNISPDKIEEYLEKCKGKGVKCKVKAIVPVHLYGHPCDMRRIMDIARRYNLKVIEDCAQAFGSKLRMANGKWQMAGSIGDYGCFSFFPAKNLGCYGDGGMIVTNNKKIAEKIRILRVHGCKKKNYQILHGFNSRLDTIQAAILKVKLKYIDKWIEKRIENAKIYTKLLSKIDEIIPPYVAPDVRHSFNYYTIRIKNGKKMRDRLMEYLKENGISCGIYYPVPQHLQKTNKHLGYKKGDFPVSEKILKEILTLPMFPELKRKEIEYIVKKVKDFFNKNHLDKNQR